MQDSSDYQRGLRAARADAQRGWVCCWMMSRDLDVDAVYGPAGLSLEQQGYAAGLSELFPSGLGEARGVLGVNRGVVPTAEGPVGS